MLMREGHGRPLKVRHVDSSLTFKGFGGNPAVDFFTGFHLMFRPVVYAFFTSALLAGCGGSTNPFVGDPAEPEPPIPNPDPNAPSMDTITRDMRGFRYDGTTLEIDMAGVSSSGRYGVFKRRQQMDIPSHHGQPAYLAYEYQETNMNRSFLAYVAENARGNLVAIAAADGGQFNEFNGGGAIRVVAYTRPTGIPDTSPTPGPETGVMNYYGSYGGVFIPGPLDPQGSPRPGEFHPGEPLSTRGEVQVSARFTQTGSGDTVEGGIANRTVWDREGNQVTTLVFSDGSTVDTTTLPSLVLRETSINSDGGFLGNVELRGGDSVGTYAGNFGGNGATDVAGVIYISPIGRDGVHEYGVFNIPRCDTAGASPICTPR
ncbi:hypothetical protein [Pseudogemmobacter humi]|uniref:Uncharacterized protein n=1 Tax=Pseudogemmobacter humi TaxID=2483812 RepID=A0A3P5XB86_9RHOB|nr:hypothetical protein [Pseudogemmobacter humi]VDC28562.1 hypothetical protein XINFAN_02141 [Pseudogemmobacter humi]